MHMSIEVKKVKNLFCDILENINKAQVLTSSNFAKLQNHDPSKIINSTLDKIDQIILENSDE